MAKEIDVEDFITDAPDNGDSLDAIVIPVFQGKKNINALKK